jgi:hypothetical protein
MHVRVDAPDQPDRILTDKPTPPRIVVPRPVVIGVATDTQVWTLPNPRGAVNHRNPAEELVHRRPGTVQGTDGVPAEQRRSYAGTRQRTAGWVRVGAWLTGLGFAGKAAEQDAPLEGMGRRSR